MSVVINKTHTYTHTHTHTQNIERKRKMCQRKIEFCTQISTCLKLSLIYVDLIYDSMVS